MRCTGRPSCCGASRATRPGSGPSRRTRSPTCSPSTWASPRGCCHTMPSGGTRARPGRWSPSGGRRRSGPWPCNGRRSGPPPAPASHAGAGLRLLAGPCALGLRRNGAADRPRAASLPGPGLQRLQRRAGLSRKPPVPRGGGPDTGGPSSSPSSRLPETPETARRSTPTTCIALWEEIDGTD